MIFLHPNFLLFMVIPLVILGFFIVTNKKTIDRIFSKEILEKLTIRQNYLGMIGKNILLFASMFLFILALARPVIPESKLDLQSKKPTFAILLDMSASMLAKDIYPNRLEFAKHKIISMLKKTDATVAVYAFSNNLYMIAPPTSDTNSLVYLIKNLKIPTNLSTSSKLIKAIKNIKEKTVLIFSDGTDIKDFSALKKTGKHLSLYLTATKKGATVLKDRHLLKDKSGNILITKANDSFKSVGKVFEFKYKDDDIYQLIPTFRSDMVDFSYLEKKELFLYPLGLASFLLFFAFYSPKRLRFKLFLLLLITVTTPKTSFASPLDFMTIKEANKAYHERNYKKSTKLYKKLVKEKGTSETFYNLANSLYKQKEYELALKNYNRVVTKDKNLKFKLYFNKANCLYKLKQYRQAYSFYSLAKSIKETDKLRQNLSLLSKVIDTTKENQNSFFAVQANQNQLKSKIKIKTFMIPLTKNKMSSHDNPW